MNKIEHYRNEKSNSFNTLNIARLIFLGKKEENKKHKDKFVLSGEISIYCDCISYLIEFFVLDFLKTKVKDFDANDIEKLKKINATLSTCVKELEDVFGLEDDTYGQDKEDC